MTKYRNDLAHKWATLGISGSPVVREQLAMQANRIELGIRRQARVKNFFAAI